MSRALADSKAYFIEMNIPEQLADAMFSIPPDEVEILTDEKLSFYRLNQQDMVLAEESALNVATRFGMTRREYMRNKGLFEKDVKAKCYPIRKEDEGLECIRDIAKKYGLHSSQQR